VCFQKNNVTLKHELIYFRESAAQGVVLDTKFQVYVGSPIQTAFDDPLVIINAADHSKFHTKLTPIIRFGEIPSDATTISQEVVVMFDPFWPENFGHAMGDDFFRVWRLLHRFDLITRDALLVNPTQDCADRGNTMSERLRSCRFHGEIAAILFNAPIVRKFTDGPWENNDNKLICAKALLAGSANIGMFNDNDGLFSEFFKYFKSQLGIQYDPIIQQKVIYLNKTGGVHKRDIINAPQLLAHLSSFFNITIQSIDITKLNITEQALLMKDVTVLLTPSGGISYDAFFLRTGAAVVHFGHFDPNCNCSSQTEGSVFENVRFVFHWSVDSRLLPADTCCPHTTLRMQESRAFFIL
jgi:hypothetical protein